MLTFMLPKPAQYNFRATVRSHGWYHLPPFQWDAEPGILSYTAALADGVRYQVTFSEMDSVIQATVDAPTAPATLEADLRWMLRLDEDLTDFYALCQSEPALQHVPPEGGGRLLRSATVWEDAVKTITTTNTAWSGTKRMCQSLVTNWGEDGAFPTAQTLAGVTIEALRTQGGLGYRAPYVQAMAQAVAQGELDLEGLKQTPLETQELYRFLRRIKGVGDYAASSLLMLLGHYAHVPVDSIAHEMVSKTFYNGESVTPAQIRAQFAPYGVYAGLAYWCWKYEG